MESGWQVVGRLARQRRERLGLRQSELEQRGGPAVATVGKLERAAQANFPTRTQRQMEIALAWPEGTIAAVLEAVDDWGAPSSDWEHLVARPDGGRTLDDAALRLVKTARAYALDTPLDRDPDLGRSPAERLFGRWYRAYQDLIEIETNYAAVRKLSPQEAVEELGGLFSVASGATPVDDDWTPPWLIDEGVSVVGDTVRLAAAADMQDQPAAGESESYNNT